MLIWIFVLFNESKVIEENFKSLSLVEEPWKMEIPQGKSRFMGSLSKVFFFQKSLAFFMRN